MRYPTDHDYISWSKIYPLPILGCSDIEINNLKSIQSVKKLPLVYVEFMRYFGKACGDLFIGYDIIHRYVGNYNMRESANKILNRDGKTLLTNSHFVFMNLQGHSYWYFSTNSGDDPSVYLYVLDDGDDDPDYPFIKGGIKIMKYLSEFLSQFIAERDSVAAQQKFLKQYATMYRKK